MTKADIVNDIAKATGTDKTVVLSVVEQFMAVVKNCWRQLCVGDTQSSVIQQVVLESLD